LAEIAEHLKERLVALTEFQLVGEFDHSLVFCDILIKNVKLEPEVVSFGRELTFIHLSNLINLLKHKPSIKFIASLPEDKRLIPAKYLEKYEQIKILLKYNKQMKVHLQPTVITEVEREGYQMVVLHNSPSRSLTDNSLFSNATPARKQVYAVDDMRLPPPSWSKFK
jgi:hypothetical protein